ncbi:chemotaxis protein CheY [Aeromicrobium erythreum]|uniref:Chemotaxis protein CheY n=1 Tax=Aeromicrobium erythreum TaxID=2041 RepID=A0A0U4D7D6_9ACTN|nr:chemotaxis protein CheY [Aeromicrobium erythreum]
MTDAARAWHDARVTSRAPRIRVLLVDDQELFRRGVSMVLGADADLELVEVGDGDQAIAAVEETPADVVLLDVRMPGRSGVEVCKTIKSISPSTGIIMLTASDEESDLYESIRSGASGYLLKDGSTYDQVAEAVRLVAAGQSLISPSMATKLLDEFVQMSRSPAPATAQLTARELQVLRLVAKGLSNREIAEELFISENTVKNHIRNMLEKLQMKSRMEAAMYAVRSNLLDDPV